MKRFLPLVFAAGLLAAGCNDSQSPQPAASDTASVMDSKVKAALAKLSPEDRALAEEQKYCASEPENLLGSMNTPIKVMVNDQPVFICCEGCRKGVLKDPYKTLKQVAELKAKAKAEK
jgi:hypothetical protein